MKKIDKKFVKNLDGKKLSTLIKKYNFDKSQFIDDDEMSDKIYNMLKNEKVSVQILNNDNYDFLISIKNYDFYGLFD